MGLSLERALSISSSWGAWRASGEPRRLAARKGPVLARASSVALRPGSGGC